MASATHEGETTERIAYRTSGNLSKIAVAHQQLDNHLQVTKDKVRDKVHGRYQWTSRISTMKNGMAPLGCINAPKPESIATLLIPRTLRFITLMDTSGNEANEQKEDSSWVDFEPQRRGQRVVVLIYNNSDVTADATDIDKHLQYVFPGPAIADLYLPSCQVFEL